LKLLKNYSHKRIIPCDPHAYHSSVGSAGLNIVVSDNRQVSPLKVGPLKYVSWQQQYLN
jgi:hypothetical protein